MSYVIAVHLPIVGMSLIPVFIVDWPLVLLPVQIAFLELIIHPACSVVFEAEEIDPKIMDSPPRGLDAPMFGTKVLTIAVLQGLSVLAATLTVYLWAVLDKHPDDVVRSVTFATLVIGNVALILVNRSWRLSVWRTFRERRNSALKWILAGAGGLLGAILVPGLRHAFNFGPLPPTGWLVAVGAGLSVSRGSRSTKSSPHDSERPSGCKRSHGEDPRLRSKRPSPLRHPSRQLARVKQDHCA